MKNKLFSTISKNIQEKSPVYLFYLFLLTLPFTIRKVIFFFPIKSSFNEYTGIYLYLSDLIIISILVAWLFSILENKRHLLSSLNKLSPKKLWISCVKRVKKVNFNQIKAFCQKCSTLVPSFLGVKRLPSRMFHVEHLFWGRTLKTIAGWNIWRDYLVLIPLLLVIWSFFSSFWAENQIIAFFRSIKILEFFLLYLFIKKKLFHSIHNVPRGTMFHVEHLTEQAWNIWKNITKILIFWGITQSIIAIWQFLVQKSIGLTFLKESIINPEILGVAKIIVGSEKYIRAYGLFPHPNILGGFLLLTIISTYLYKKHFLKDPEISKCSTPVCRRGSWNNCIPFEIEKLKIGKNRLILNVFLLFQIIALFLTFSKSAMIGLLIAVIYVFIQFNRSNFPSQSECSTWNNKKKTVKNVPPASSAGGRRTIRGKNKQMFHVEQIRKLKYYFLLSFFIFGILLFYFKVDPYSLFIQSLEERFIYLTASAQAISENLIWGLGQGQFVWEMDAYSLQNLAFWQFQPVHNVFLLILSEMGMIGLFFFIWFLLELFKPESSTPARSNSQSELDGWNIYLKSILLGFIFIMIFDHYLWDIQQGSLMLWTIVGLISVKK